MLAQRKRKCSLIIPPDEPTSLSQTAHKKMKYPSVSPHQESVSSMLPPPLATHLSSSISSTLPSIVSEHPQVPPQTVRSLKKTLQTSKKSYPSPPSSGTQTVDLRHKTPSPLTSWKDFILYRAVIPSEWSFATHCSCSHTAPPHTLKIPSQSWPYLYPRTLLTHPLLDQFPWHLNQMLPSNTIPEVDVDNKKQRDIWQSLYEKYRAVFHSQLSWCLAAHHNLLTCCLHSDSIAIKGPIISPA